jgi:CheY-like chemotaxis protein
MSFVIVVDDQSSNRMVLSMLAATLEPGIHVEAFADPIKALSHAQEHTPDLLITDFQMPTINGAELIRRFRDLSACREVPAVVVTAHEDVRLRALALEAGANDFILSPLDHDEFRAQSRRLLEMRRSGQLAASTIGISADQSVEFRASTSQIGLLNGLVESLAAKLLFRTVETAHLSAEMRILLDATDTAAIFVDHDLLIRQFTPAVSEIYALKAHDLGRSLSGMACKLDYSSLIADFKKVLFTGETFERYLQSRRGRRHYRLRLVPVRDGRAPTLGAILIFTEIPVWHERLTANWVH